MFKVMLSAHPEICPHEWKLTYLDENGARFICKHCGQEETDKTLAIADDKYNLKRTNEY